jgi:hypothetical protein
MNEIGRGGGDRTHVRSLQRRASDPQLPLECCPARIPSNFSSIAQALSAHRSDLQFPCVPSSVARIVALAHNPALGRDGGQRKVLPSIVGVLHGRKKTSGPIFGLKNAPELCPLGASAPHSPKQACRKDTYYPHWWVRWHSRCRNSNEIGVQRHRSRPG